MDHNLDRTDDEDICSENRQTDFLQNLETKKWDKLELKAGHGQDLQSEQDEQERDHIQHEDPQASTSLQFSEENILEHLLSEVISLEGQIEKLESHQDCDSDQGVNMEEKIMEIKKQIGEMDNNFVKEDACDEAHKLKEKLIARIENFCKDMALLDTKLGMFQMQGNPDSQSPEEMGMDDREPLLLQASSPSLEESSPPHITMWMMNGSKFYKEHKDEENWHLALNGKNLSYLTGKDLKKHREDN
ncbi:hypothetical protein MG293_002715 [Ovis ammon polii]|uniref:Uncharacterized protein n=1 Tax=Ovis ammon polii TaxID=230172 RepID=A0AAD4YCQ4_OVIAM|nr:hypothetical protein MG293_002715 [Ovis ammon polii]KAI4576402.1 hypothetical protein MJT46_002237 [Ovis ammon polii x Ovis aries]